MEKRYTRVLSLMNGHFPRNHVADSHMRYVYPISADNFRSKLKYVEILKEISEKNQDQG